MAIDVRILPSRGLVVVRYSGTILIADTMVAFAAYMRHPDYAPGQKQLIDLTHVTAFEQDYVKVMQMQAKKAEAYLGNGAHVLMVYLAPANDTLGLAQLVARSWDGLDGVTCLLQQDEAAALDLLGISERSVSALMASVD